MVTAEDMATQVQRTFEEIHRRVFLGDPAANPRLKVEVVGAAMAEDTPVLLLIAPWTLNGVAFPPDDRFPDSLVVTGRPYPVFRTEVEAIGRYCSVNLVPDVSMLRSPEEARTVAAELVGPFHEAVTSVRGELRLPDPSRRRLLRSLTGRAEGDPASSLHPPASGPPGPRRD
jgi:hypothetical protein